jgi:hypothetical protein
MGSRQSFTATGAKVSNGRVKKFTAERRRERQFGSRWTEIHSQPGQVNANQKKVRPRINPNGHEFNPEQAHLPQWLKPHFFRPLPQA